MKRISIFGAVALLGIVSVGSLASLGSSPFIGLGVGEDIVWEHYNKVEATDTTFGVKEYWISCSDNAHQFTAPATGVIHAAKDLSATDKAYIGELKDDRYIVPKYQSVIDGITALPTTSSFQIYDGTEITRVSTAYSALSSEGQALVTNSSTLTSLATSYDAKYGVLNNAETSGYSAWQYGWSTSDITTTTDATYDVVTQVKSITTSGDACCLKSKSTTALADYQSVVFYMWSESAQDIYFKNDSWTALTGTNIGSGGLASLTANTWTKFEITTAQLGTTIDTLAICLGWQNSFSGDVRITSLFGAKPGNQAINIAANLGGGDVCFGSTSTYSNISCVEFDVKVTNDGTSDWWGVALSTTRDNYATTSPKTGTWATGDYTLDANGMAHCKYKLVVAADNYWWVNFTGSSLEKDAEATVDCTGARYINFISGTDHNTSIIIDNITVTYDTDKTVTENFNAGSSTTFSILKSAAVSYVTL